MNKKILIIGGLGYIGSRLLQILKQNNISVTVVDICVRKEYTHSNNEYHTIFDNTDVRDLNANFITQFDIIVYLCGVSLDFLRGMGTILAENINEKAFDYILDSIKNTPIKLIYASTCSVYGNSDSNTIITEHSSPEPNTTYAGYKLRCEEKIKKTIENYNIVRSGTVFGFSPIFRNDLLVNRICSSKDDIINVKEAFRSITWIDHLCDYYFNLITEIYNFKLINIVSMNIYQPDLCSFLKRNYKIDGTDTRNYKVTSLYLNYRLGKNQFLEICNKLKSITSHGLRTEREFWNDDNIINHRAVYLADKVIYRSGTILSTSAYLNRFKLIYSLKNDCELTNCELELKNIGKLINLNLNIEHKGSDYVDRYYNFFLESKDFLDVIYNSKDKYIIQCTYGKDRTGVAIIYFMLKSGLSIEEIINEYFLSEKFFLEEKYNFPQKKKLYFPTKDEILKLIGLIGLSIKAQYTTLPNIY